MSQHAKKLLEDALRLPLKSRALLAEKLIASLDADDGLDEAIDEAERRWQAYKEGKIKGIPVEEIFPNLSDKDEHGKKS